MPAPRAVPADLHALLDDTLTLYDGLFSHVRIRAALRSGAAARAHRSRADQARGREPVDNAIEATSRSGTITIETQHDPSNNLARLVLADDGPGIPPADRDKLFMPYYSTKRRGSGLGLAIVRRIVAEHGGTIEVGENTPTGARFTIELPC